MSASTGRKLQTCLPVTSYHLLFPIGLVSFAHRGQFSTKNHNAGTRQFGSVSGR